MGPHSPEIFGPESQSRVGKEVTYSISQCAILLTRKKQGE
jgi:hypothetical protein